VHRVLQRSALEGVRDAYGAHAELYIDLFGTTAQVHPDAASIDLVPHRRSTSTYAASLILAPECAEPGLVPIPFNYRFGWLVGVFGRVGASGGGVLV
jgi:hypothetical protein